MSSTARRAVPAIAAIVAAAVVPLQLGSVWAFIGGQVAAYTVAALSLVVLTGYAGQISLGQGAFLGVGAFAVGILSTRLGIPMWGAIPLAMLVSLPVSLVIGLPSLRLRGFQLAIATLAFAVAAERWVFGWLMGKLVGKGSAGSDALRIGIERPRPFGVDLREDFLYYLFALAITIVCVWLVRNLSTGRTGRALFAVREGEVAASTLGINVQMQKLTAFAISGMLASLAGVLLGMNLYNAHGTSYHFFLSITLFSVAVLGGIRSVWGAVLGGLFFAVTPEILNKVPVLDRPGIVDLVSGIGLVAFMVAEPEGLIGAFRSLGKRLRPSKKAEEVEETAGPKADHLPEAPQRPPSELGPPLLTIERLSQRFGGIQALSEVDLEIPQGAIFGLIGPNGAGKTTLFNAISGLVVPQGGRVRFNDQDLGPLPPHRRARLGIARSYQTIRLFPQLTVEENLLVALVPAFRANILDDFVRSPRTRAEEAEGRRRAREVLDLLDMEHLARVPVSDLPFGHLKMTELARALVQRPKLLMLDEPAGGLDEDETRVLASAVVRIREEFETTVFLIEHDMELVMPICDLVAVLDFGELIASGTPDEIRRNPDVIAAYLGGQETKEGRPAEAQR